MPRESKRGSMIGEMSQGGSGEEMRVFDFVKAEGQVWRRRWESWVQRGRGAVKICLYIQRQLSINIL